MNESIKLWGQKEWENYIKSLIRIEYGSENYVDMPDRDQGDFGIECFTCCGQAYQMYAPTEPLAINELVKKIKRKISDDIDKFIDNKEDLEKSFGNIKIQRWVLVTPRHESSKVVQFLSRKTKYVLSKNLPYVTLDFQAIIHTDKDYPIAKGKLLNKAIHTIRFEIPEHDTELDKWINEHSEDVRNLTEKLCKLRPKTNQNDITELRDTFIRFYVDSCNLLDVLRSEWPEVWERIIECKSDKEYFLTSACQVTEKQPAGLLQEQLNELMDAIKSDSPALHSEQIRLIAYGFVSEWLQRCPLNFYK